MADLQMTVFEDAGAVAFGPVLQEDMITVTGTSAQTEVIAGLARQLKTVRIYADIDCFVTWGVSPTATIIGDAGRMIGANNPEYFSIPVGERLAAILR